MKTYHVHAQVAGWFKDYYVAAASFAAACQIARDLASKECPRNLSRWLRFAC